MTKYYIVWQDVCVKAYYQISDFKNDNMLQSVSKISLPQIVKHGFVYNWFIKKFTKCLANETAFYSGLRH